MMMTSFDYLKPWENQERKKHYTQKKKVSRISDIFFKEKKKQNWTLFNDKKVKCINIIAALLNDAFRFESTTATLFTRKRMYWTYETERMLFVVVRLFRA